MVNQTGRAYAFFDCRYSREQIEAELPAIRAMVETPSELELSLTEKPERINDNKELAEALKVAKKIELDKMPESQRRDASISFGYVLQAKYPHKTNDDAATKLVTIMNGAYMSTPLWEYGEEFFGRIIYRRGDAYVAAER